MIGNKKDNGIYFTKPTPDGWKLIIKRYKSTTDNKAKYPVILCHGFASNKYSCDFGEEGTKDWDKYSLAAYLSKGGEHNDLSFDVWVPELRGRNGSQTFDPDEYPEKYNWSLDEYVDEDIPAIIDCVLKEYQDKNKPKIDKVFWVGKSMGGMLAYAYGIRGEGNKNFKGVVTMGSPVKFEQSKEFIKLLVKICPRKISGPVHLLERLNWNKPLLKLLKNKMAKQKHIEKRILEKYLKKGLNNTLSLKVVNHFSIFMRHNTFCRYPKYPWLYDLCNNFPLLRKYFAPYSYTENFEKFQVPLLVIAGMGDDVANELDVKYAFDHVGSQDKEYILFSKDKEYSSYDYGHLDLNLGKKAKKEVYPRIHKWLTEKT